MLIFIFILKCAEYQKLGLPHVHILIWLDHKITPDDIIPAGICDQGNGPVLFEVTYGHKIWAMTERIRSRIQAAEMRFLRAVVDAMFQRSCQVARISPSSRFPRRAWNAIPLGR